MKRNEGRDQRKEARGPGKALLGFSAFLVFSFLLGSFVPSAEAVQIKRVMRGTAQFDTTDVSQSVTLPYAVDLTKAIVLLTDSATTTTGDQNFNFTAQFADTQTVNISRAGASNEASPTWEVIEFADGATVQNGITTVQYNGTANKIKNISIATINTATSLPILQVQAAWTIATATNELHFLPTFPDANTLRIERKDAGTSTKAVTVVWQVVNFTKDVTIQSGSTYIPATNVAPDNVDKTVTAPTNPMLFTYFSGAVNTGTRDTAEWTEGIYCAANVAGDCSGAASYPVVRFYRYDAINTTGSEVYVQYYLVDFGGESPLSQSGTVSWSSSTATIKAAGGSLTIDSQANSGVQNTTPIRVKTTANHGLATGDYITIAGAGSNAVNICTTAGTGVASLTPVRISTAPTAHGFANGQTVVIAGTTMPSYTINTTAGTGVQNTTPVTVRCTTNHTFTTGQKVTITGSTSTNSFTIDTNANSGIQDTTPVIVKTTANHTFTSDATHFSRVLISGAGAVAINGYWYVTKIDATHVSLNGSTASGSSGGGTIAASINNENPPVTLGAIAYWIITTTGTATDFTLNGTAASGTGSSSGTALSLINGTYTISNVATNTFTLDGTTASGAGGSGTAALNLAANINKDWMINVGTDCNGGNCTAMQFELVGSTAAGVGGGGTVTGGNLSGIGKRANGQTVRITASAAHGLATGDIINISGAGDTYVDGNWPVIYQDTTSFFLSGSDSENLAASNGGGTIQLPVVSTLGTPIVPARTIDVLSTRATASANNNRYGDDMQVAGWLANRQSPNGDE